MKGKLLLPAVILALVTLACSLFAPPRGRVRVTPTPRIEQVTRIPPVRTATVRSTRTVVPTGEATPEGRPAPTESGPVDATPAASPEQAASGTQPVEIQGQFTYTNDFIMTYYVEHIVALIDLYGFVQRDQEWEVPVDSQVLGYTIVDEARRTAIFSLQLPIRPEGELVDVDQDDQQETGVQVFTVAFSPNLAGGPYSDAADPSHGWPSYLASTKNDSENQDEIIGGRLVIWSPDDSQAFPSGFGEDGLLFTADDPTMPVPAGYSVIDLDTDPFTVIRDAEPQVTLYEPDDAAVKDFSELSYSEAFEQMFEIIRKEYAFNGIEGKQPDWDALYAELSPRVVDAETEQDAEAFYHAMRDFVTAFKDGHVGLNGGPVEAQLVSAQIASGYGFAIRELDDGRVIAVFVLPGGPAAEAGMQVGAEIIEFNGTPVSDAIAAVDPPTAPHSTDFSLRYQQARYLLRAPEGTQAAVTFANPGEEPRTEELTSMVEQQSHAFTSTLRGFDSNALPVEYIVTGEGIGYIRITSNFDDLNLILRLFERALTKFEENQIESLIIDMRQNSGGAPLSLAGFLTDNEVPLGQLEYYSERTGQFEPEGPPDVIKPQAKQFRFDKMFLLVDQACASACEIEAYGFSQVPGMVVIGQYPTSGTEGEVARGQFKLPEDMSLQIPTGRFVLPDGSIFLEGTGVQPTERIPITEETVLAQDDPVLQRAIELSRE